MRDNENDNYDSDEERILLALKENGIDLEWRTATTLEGFGFTVKLNVRGETGQKYEGAQTIPIETDIIAEILTPNHRQALIIECKGAAASCPLVLIETNDKTKSVLRMFASDKTLFFNFSKVNIVGAAEATAYTKTGDFLDLKKTTTSGFRLSDKNSNLYKALLQVNDSVDANFENYLIKLNGEDSIDKGVTEIIPMIVTNAKIKVVNMVKQKVRGVNWVLHESPTVFAPGSRILSRSWNGHPDKSGRRALQGVWIVNSESLVDFLKQYPDT